MRKIRATFTGANGSLGYINGKRYAISINEGVRDGEIRIWRTGYGSESVRRGFCVYNSFNAFLDNWDRINKQP